MSEITHRPEPASPELAERARPNHYSLADDIVSEIGYWGPETLLAGASASVGMWLWHPAALPIAAAALAVRIAVAKCTYRRRLRERSERWAKEHAELRARRDADNRAERPSTEDAEGREGIA